MAQIRSKRQRRLAAIATAVLFLASCAVEPPTGFLSNGESVAGIQLSTSTTESESRSIAVRVVLPDGYEAAEGFVQRLVLETDTQSWVAERHDLDSALVLTPFLGSETEATLHLTIGYCPQLQKEICLVDLQELPVRFMHDGEERVDLVYTPNPSD